MQVSNCCGAKLLVMTDGEGTSHYDCAGCGRPCDPTPTASTEVEEVWKSVRASHSGLSEHQWNSVEAIVAHAYQALIIEARMDEHSRIDKILFRDDMTEVELYAEAMKYLGERYNEIQTLLTKDDR